MARDTSKTLQERVATSHVKPLGVDLDAMAAISNIFRVATLFRKTAERQILSKHQLSFSGFTVLWVLWVWGEKQSYDLAEECGIAKGTLTGIVSTLEKRGLVDSKPHPSDGRRKFIFLKDSGLSMIESLFLEINQLEVSVTSTLNDTEKPELSRMLRILLHNMEDS